MQLSRTSIGLLAIAAIVLVCAFIAQTASTLSLSMLVFEWSVFFALASSVVLGVRIALRIIKMKPGIFDRLFISCCFILSVELLCSLLSVFSSQSIEWSSDAAILFPGFSMSLIPVVYYANIYSSMLGRFTGKRIDASLFIHLGAILTVALTGLVTLLFFLSVSYLPIFMCAAEIVVILRTLAISGIFRISRIFENRGLRHALVQVSVGLCLLLVRDFFVIAATAIGSFSNIILDASLQILGVLFILSGMAIYYRIQSRKLPFASSANRNESLQFEIEISR